MNRKDWKLVESLGQLLGGIPSEHEKIEGTSVAEAAQMVELSIAFTPVVEAALPVDPAESDLSYVPRPSEVVYDAGRRKYAIVDVRTSQFAGHVHRSFRWLSESEHKVMRARFLLLHGFYYKRLPVMPSDDRQQVLAWYFAGQAVWTPQPGSPLAQLLGMAGEAHSESVDDAAAE